MTQCEHGAGNMTDFQKKIDEAFNQAQAKASARAREFEAEARKVLETLGDRAQAEVKVLLQRAQNMSREQMGILGVELEDKRKRMKIITHCWYFVSFPPPGVRLLAFTPMRLRPPTRKTLAVIGVCA